MTSSVEPELHNVSQRAVRRGPSHGRRQYTFLKNWRRSDMQFRGYARGQTDRQTRSSQYFASPTGAEVIAIRIAHEGGRRRKRGLCLRDCRKSVEQSRRSLTWTDPAKEFMHQVIVPLLQNANCMQLYCCLIFKFIDILKWYPLLHTLAPPGGPHEVYKSSQPREQRRYMKHHSTISRPR